MNIKLDENTTIEVKEDSSIDVDRCDFVSKVGKVTRTDEGYLRGNAAVARIGIMSYLLPDGSTRRELVPAETLFNRASMDSLQLRPVTNQHPPEKLLNNVTVKRSKVGFTGEAVKQDGDFLMTSMVITDKDAVDSVESGRQELSPGYRATVVIQPGTFQGQHYDAIQTKRVYNHVAICDKARGGTDLRINFDSIEIEKLDGFEFIINQDSNNNPTNHKKEYEMPKLTLNGIEYEAAQEVINAYNDAVAKTSELQTNLDKANADLDTSKARVDELEKRDINAEVKSGIESRLALIEKAKTVLPSDRHDALVEKTDAEIKAEVIKHRFPEAKLDDCSDDYVQARFDSVLELVKNDKHNDASAKNRQKSAPNMDNSDDDEEKVDADESYERMVKSVTTRWQPKKDQ